MNNHGSNRAKVSPACLRAEVLHGVRLEFAHGNDQQIGLAANDLFHRNVRPRLLRITEDTVGRHDTFGLAETEEQIRRHGELSGIPVTRVTEIPLIIDPLTANT